MFNNKLFSFFVFSLLISIEIAAQSAHYSFINDSIAAWDKESYSSEDTTLTIFKTLFKNIDFSSADTSSSDLPCFFAADIASKISLASYSNYSSSKGGGHKWLTKFSLDIGNIQGTSLNFSSRFRYKGLPTSDGDSVVSNSTFNADNLITQDLSISYATQSGYNIVLGRKSNSRVRSTGPIDGLQFDKSIKEKNIGVIVGYKPKVVDYQFNDSIFEYGLYFADEMQIHKYTSNFTLGFFDQINTYNVARRYLYFQQSLVFNTKLSLFSSFELDLLDDAENGTRDEMLNLKNIYISSKYSFRPRWSLMCSYDTRDVIYYNESYKSEIEQLIDDNQARQGMRLRLSYKEKRGLFSVLSFSNRFKSDSQKNAKNYYAIIGYSDLPRLRGSLSVSVNKNESKDRKSKIVTYKYGRPMLKGKSSVDFYLRTVCHDYLTNSMDTSMNYIGANFSIYMNKQFILSIFAEYSNSTLEDRYRINAKLVKRFNTTVKRK